MIDLQVHDGLPTAPPIEITDHFGLPMLILPEVANMLHIEPGQRLTDAAQFWQVLNNNSLTTIAYLREVERRELRKQGINPDLLLDAP